MARETEPQVPEEEALKEQVAPEEEETMRRLSRSKRGHYSRMVRRRVPSRGRLATGADQLHVS
jgi:hypothetical protein